MSNFVLSCSVTRSKCSGHYSRPETLAALELRRKDSRKQRLQSSLDFLAHSNDDVCHTRSKVHDGVRRSDNLFSTVSRSSSCRLEVSSCAMRKSEVDRLRDEVRRKVKPRSRSLRFATDSWQARLDGLGVVADAGCGGQRLKPLRICSKSVWSLSSSDSDSDYEDAIAETNCQGGKREECENDDDRNKHITLCQTENSFEAHRNLNACNLLTPTKDPNSTEDDIQEVNDSVEDIIHSVEEMTRSVLNSVEEYDSSRVPSCSLNRKKNCIHSTEDKTSSSLFSDRAPPLQDKSNEIKETKTMDTFHEQNLNPDVICCRGIKTEINGEQPNEEHENSCSIDSVDYCNSLYNQDFRFPFLGINVTEKQDRTVCRDYNKPRLNSFGEDGISSDFGSSMEFLDSSNSEIGYYIDVDSRIGSKKLVSDDSDLGSSKDDLNSDSDSDALSEEFVTGKCMTCDEISGDIAGKVDFSQNKRVETLDRDIRSVGNCRLCVDFSTDEGTFSISSDTYSPPLIIGNVTPFSGELSSLTSVSLTSKQVPVIHQEEELPLVGESDHGDIASSQRNECSSDVTQSMPSRISEQEPRDRDISLLFSHDLPKSDELPPSTNISFFSSVPKTVTCELPLRESSNDEITRENSPKISTVEFPSKIPLARTSSDSSKGSKLDGDNVSVHSSKSYRLSNIIPRTNVHSLRSSYNSNPVPEGKCGNKVRLIDLIKFTPQYVADKRSYEEVPVTPEEMFLREHSASLGDENDQLTKAKLFSSCHNLENQRNMVDEKLLAEHCDTSSEDQANKQIEEYKMVGDIKHSSAPVSDLDLPLTSLENRFPSFFASVSSVHNTFRDRASTIETSPSLAGVSLSDAAATTTTTATTDSLVIQENIKTNSIPRVKCSSSTTLSQRCSSCLKTVASALRRLPSPSKVLHRSSSIFHSSHKCAYDLQLASLAYFSSCPSTPVTGKRRLTATPSLLTFTSSSPISQSLPPSPCTPLPATPPSTPSSLRLLQQPSTTTTISPLLLPSPSSQLTPASTPVLHSYSKSQRHLLSLDGDNSTPPASPSKANSSSLSSLFSSSTLSYGLSHPSSPSPMSSQSSLPTKKPSSSFWPPSPSSTNINKFRKLRYRSLSLDSRISSQCQCNQGDALDWDQHQDPTSTCLTSLDCSTNSLRVHGPFLLPL